MILIFNTTIPAGKEIYGDDWSELLTQESARVEISDASRVDGLGERTAAYLREKGINITAVSLSPRFFDSKFCKKLFRHGLYRPVPGKFV